MNQSKYHRMDMYIFLCPHEVCLNYLFDRGKLRHQGTKSQLHRLCSLICEEIMTFSGYSFVQLSFYY